MSLQERRHDVGAEREGYTTIVLTPADDFLLRVRPQQVAQQASVGDVRGTGQTLDLVQRPQLRRQTAVHAEDLLVNDGSDGQRVEAVREDLP